VPSIAELDLPSAWRDRSGVSRDLGTAGLKKNEDVLLRVPSAIVPETFNILLNPAHKQASRFRITDASSYPFHMRLKR
jgi:RES domain-containing protein